MCARHEQLGDQRGPTRLVRCADAAAGVAVKIFVERNAILVVWIGLHCGLVAQHGAFATRVLQEDARQSVRQLVRHGVDGEHDESTSYRIQC